MAISTQAEALTAWNERNPALAKARLATVDPDARFWEWGYLKQYFSPTTYLADKQANMVATAWSPDMRTLAIGSGDGQVWLLDPSTGQVRHQFRAHADRVVTLSYTHDGSHLLSPNYSEIRVWSPVGQQLRERAVGADQLTMFTASPTEPLAAIGTIDGRIHLWNTLTGKDERTITMSNKSTVRVQALAFDPTGRMLARATSENIVSLITLAGEATHVLSQQHEILVLAFSPDGTRLVGGGGLKLLMWDVPNRKLLHDLPIYPSPPDGYRHVVTGIDFRGDGRRVATCCGGYGLTQFPGPRADNSVRIWDVDSGRLVRLMRSTHGSVQTIRYRPDGQQLAGTTIDFESPQPTGAVHVWDTRADGEYRLLNGHVARINGLAFHPEGTRLLSVSGMQQIQPDSSDMVMWDIALGQAIYTHRKREVLDQVAMSPNGQTFAVASTTGQLDIHQVSDGRLQRTIPHAHTEYITSLNYLTPDRLVSTGDDGLVRLWNTITGQLVRELKRPFKPRDLAPIGVCHPHGEYVVLGSRSMFGDAEEELVVWYPVQSSDPTVLDRVKGGITAMAFSANGELLAALNHTGELTVWKIATRQRLLHFKAHQNVGASVTFSPDGRRIATMSRDRSVKLWDIETGRETWAFEGPTFAGDNLRFSPDGQRLVAGGGGAYELLPAGGDLFVWDTTPRSPMTSQHDAAWHAAQLMQSNLTNEGTCFHSRYAVQTAIHPMILPQLFAHYFELLKRYEGQRDPRLANLQRDYALVFERLANAHSANEAAQSTLANYYLAPQWSFRRPSEARSANGTTLTASANEYTIASGPNPDQDVYTLTFPADGKPITGVKLWLIPDVQTRHLGRAENGNFDLSEIELFAIDDDPLKPKRVPFRRAWASYNAVAKDHYSKNDMRPEWAIDGDLKTGWNSWPKIMAPQQLIVEPELVAKLPKLWQIRLRFQGPYARHSVCNFGLSFTSQTRPLLRHRWVDELSRRPTSWWTIRAAAAWFDNAPEQTRAFLQKNSPPEETALALALAAWAAQQTKDPNASIRRQQALNASHQHPNDPLPKDVLGGP